MREDRVINVFYHERLVGTLAMTNERKAAFEYADEWLENGFSISPFSLPLEKKVCVPVKNYFNGLWGVFADSLPDAWGQLLLDRMLKEKGHNIYKVYIGNFVTSLNMNGASLTIVDLDTETKYLLEQPAKPVGMKNY